MKLCYVAVFLHNDDEVFITLPDFMHIEGATAESVGKEQEEAENYLYTMAEVVEETGQDLPKPSELDEINLRTSLDYYEIVRKESDYTLPRPHYIEIKYIETEYEPFK